MLRGLAASSKARYLVAWRLAVQITRKTFLLSHHKSSTKDQRAGSNRGEWRQDGGVFRAPQSTLRAMSER
jgi:hypothetical protein